MDGYIFNFPTMEYHCFSFYQFVSLQFIQAVMTQNGDIKHLNKIRLSKQEGGRREGRNDRRKWSTPEKIHTQQHNHSFYFSTEQI